MFGPPTPILRSFDEARAKAFYIDFLGFDLLFEHRFEEGLPLFMAVLFKWGQVADSMTGIKWAVVVGLASAVPTMLYGWVYGGHNTGMTMIDAGHLLLGHIAAGAILGGWK